jgi:hypothetical protein
LDISRKGVYKMVKQPVKLISYLLLAFILTACNSGAVKTVEATRLVPQTIEVTRIAPQTAMVTQGTVNISPQETNPLIALSESIMDTRYYDGTIVISQYYTFLGYGLYAEAYQLLSKSAQSPQSLEDYVVNMGRAFQEVEIVAIVPFYVAVERQGGYTQPDPEYRMRFAVQIRAWGEGGMSGSRPNGDLLELFLELILEDGSWKINSFATAPIP